MDADDSALSEGAREVYRAAVLDDELRRLREEYVRTVVDELCGTAGWLGVDSFFGGVCATLASTTVEERAEGGDRTVQLLIRATAALTEMAAELARACVTSLEAGMRYATAALVRQLIEVEYLLTAFDADPEFATTWTAATPDEIRSRFSPKRLRAVGEFSDVEYWRHCDMGGHPSPQGVTLLSRGGFAQASHDVFLTASIWCDLGQHLRRLWAAVHRVLSKHHSRFQVVRAAGIEAVKGMEEKWTAEDPLAQPVDWSLLGQIADPDLNR